MLNIAAATRTMTTLVLHRCLRIDAVANGVGDDTGRRFVACAAMLLLSIDGDSSQYLVVDLIWRCERNCLSIEIAIAAR